MVLSGRGGKKLSNMADVMNPVVSCSTDSVYMGIASQTVIKKDPQVPGSTGTGDIFVTNSYSRHTGFIPKFKSVNINSVLPSFNLSWLMGIQCLMAPMQASNLASTWAAILASVSSHAR